MSFIHTIEVKATPAYRIRTERLTPDECLAIVDSNTPVIEEKIAINLNSFLEYGVDGLNDEIESILIGSKSDYTLSDIGWDIIGAHEGQIVFEVTATLESLDQG